MVTTMVMEHLLVLFQAHQQVDSVIEVTTVLQELKLNALQVNTATIMVFLHLLAIATRATIAKLEQLR